VEEEVDLLPTTPHQQHPTHSPTMLLEAAIAARQYSSATYVKTLFRFSNIMLTRIQLPWSTSNDDLIELFQTIGKVEQAEIQYEGNGRSKGTGVVRFDNSDNGESAITKFTGYQYGGRPLGLSFVKYIVPGQQYNGNMNGNGNGDSMMEGNGEPPLTQDQIM